MAEPFEIPTVVSELEGAGVLGGVAIAFLAPFFGGPPGAAVSTGTGFVWTKTVLSGAEGTSVPLGALGRLKLDSGAVSVTLAVNWYGPRAEVDILFQLNDGQALTLELNQNVFQVADRVTMPGESGDLIGYDRSTLGPVEIPLPALALEFSFRPGLGDGIAASIQTYHPGSSQGSEGIFEWTPEDNKLLVFRKLFDIAFGVQKLFVDLSATNGVADFKSRFADVYTASWKGIGAQRIDVVVPVEDMFFNASAEGFLVDFDGNFTGDFSLSWQNPTGEIIKAIDAEISLRENDPRRGEFGVTVDLNGVKEAADRPTANASTASPSTAETERANRAKEEFALRKADLDFDGQVRFSGALTYGVLAGGTEPARTVYALDLTGAAIKDGQGNTIHAFEGAGAVAVLWTVTALIGVPLFIRGAQEEDASDALTALGMIFLAIVVGDEVEGPTTTHLPRLSSINLNALKLRYVHIAAERALAEGEVSRYTQRLVELGLDLGAVFSMDCRLTDLIDKLLSVSIEVGSNLIGLFGSTLESAEVKGNLELEFGNLFLRFLHTEAHATAEGPVAAAFDIFPSIDEGLARLLEERSPVVTARQIPDIKLVPSEGSSAIPRPVTEVKAVRSGEGEALRRGVSIAISGLGNASMAIATPAAGVVVFWSPEFSIEPMAQLQMNPEFSFLMPPLAYARGVIDIGKPLPSIGGEQSRIAVDVGIRNKEVKAGKNLSADDQKKLRDFKNYEWAFGGEIVWGDATGGPEAEEFSFLFVEVHYEGKTPLFTLGPVGFYGLGGLFGHNIAPGIPTNQQSAVGIANWIFGDGKGSFNSVRDWPSGEPTPATWHPDRDFEHDRDRYALGLFVKVGSVGDGGKSVSVDAIVMVGFPEFWLAMAGFAIIKPINAELTVIIVYDHPSRSFVVKVAFNYKVDKKNGRIVDMKNRLEIGTTKTPKRRWFYLGHYADDKGGPGGAELFKFINTKFYVVYDTEGTNQFGIVLVENPKVKPPAIPGPLFGFGALFQFGPKTYGPSWLNISLFAGLGFNVAVGSNPFLIYGDIYAVGHVQVKIAVFKGKLGFAARLYGLASEDFYRFAGEIEVRINLPWPLSDISKSFDFVFEDGVPAFPPPVITTTASALGRVEPRSIELTPGQTERVPIDSVIAIAFDKPIFEVQAVTPGNTKLTINDPQLPDDAPDPIETLTTEFADRKYTITLKHVIRYVRIERRPLPLPPDTGWMLVGEVAAAWDPPDDIADDGAPEPGSEPHHVLYLNTFVAPELQFSQSALEQHYDWTQGWGTIPPCLIGDRICLLAPGEDPGFSGPEVDQSGTFWSLDFVTGQGDARIEELRWHAASYGGLPRNLHRLAWVEGQLDLPEHTAIGLPDADEMDLVLRFGALRPANPPVLKRMEAVVAVKLRGFGVVSRVRIVARVDAASPCSFALETEVIQHDSTRLAFTADVERCTPGFHELAVRVGLVASDYVHLIDEVTVQGPFLVWDDEQVAKTQPGHLIEVFSRLQESLLFRLEQVCFRRSRTSRVHWKDSLLAVDVDGNTGPDALWNNLLLVPDSEYRIRYGLTSFATSRVQNADADAPNETTEQPGANSESTEELDTTLRTVRFRTEGVPSQDPERYVGLTYPAVRDGSASPYYPDHFRPFFTLRNNGLIHKVYGRHYGAAVLRSEIVDIHGTPLAPEIVDTINIGSSPLDETFEDVVSQCLPDAQHLSWVRIDVWQAQLSTGRDYSMQLTDLRPGATSPLWSRSFRTSAFRTFPEHVEHAEVLLADAQVLPVVDATTVRQTLAGLVGAVRSGAAPGRDALVEAIYRELLGIDGGSLRRHFGVAADFAGYVIGRDETGERLWGMVLELDEPLIGRQGVSLTDLVPADAEALAAQGLHLVDKGDERQLLVADSAGTRVIVLNSGDAVDFAPFGGEVKIALRYAPGDELTLLARRYLEATARPLSPAEFQAKLDDLIAVIGSHPDLGINLEVHDATLTLPFPALEVVPPPDTDDDPDGDGGGGGTGGGGSDGGGGGEPIPEPEEEPIRLPRPEESPDVPTRPGRRPRPDEEPPAEYRPTPPGERPQAARVPDARGSKRRRAAKKKTGKTAYRPRRPRKD
ncbi:MAG TPA: hypothetical protein VHF45_04470 [Thermoleophilaceae bacterium]|nr:hypothetical protein [Thermoleophilaceae bacterium]